MDFEGIWRMARLYLKSVKRVKTSTFTTFVNVDVLTLLSSCPCGYILDLLNNLHVLKRKPFSDSMFISEEDHTFSNLMIQFKKYCETIHII